MSGYCVTNHSPFTRGQSRRPLPRAQHLLTHDGVAISALSVPHGRAPALVYRLDGPRFSIVFGGDQSGLDPSFSEFASRADVLVFHAIVSDRARGDRLETIVGLPERFSALARASQAKRVVLSHLMGQPSRSPDAFLWSLADIEGVVESLRREYKGRVTLALDFECIAL